MKPKAFSSILKKLAKIQAKVSSRQDVPARYQNKLLSLFGALANQLPSTNETIARFTELIEILSFFVSRCPFEIQHKITLIWIDLSVAKETHILLSNTSFSQLVFSSILPNLSDNTTTVNYSFVLTRLSDALGRRIVDYGSGYQSQKSFDKCVDEQDTPVSTIFSSPALVKHMCLSSSSAQLYTYLDFLPSLFQKICQCSLFFPRLNHFLAESTLTHHIVRLPSETFDQAATHAMGRKYPSAKRRPQPVIPVTKQTSTSGQVSIHTIVLPFDIRSQRNVSEQSIRAKCLPTEHHTHTKSKSLRMTGVPIKGSPRMKRKAMRGSQISSQNLKVQNDTACASKVKHGNIHTLRQQESIATRQILSTPRLRNLSFVADESSMYYILMILQRCTWLTNNRFPFVNNAVSQIKIEPVRDVVLHEVLIPMEPFLVKICRNRRLLSRVDQCGHTLQLLLNVFQESGFYQPTLDFTCSSRIPMIYESLLTNLGHEPTNEDMHLNMDNMIFQWKSCGTDAKHRGRIMLKTLEQEGFRNGVEQTLFYLSSSLSGLYMRKHSFEIMNFMGMNGLHTWDDDM
ncbi:hypothetical protein BLNAU_9905 [Blattamonas nauphoetae]|uniref:Uncharacterized protein n=1 Tax=Blattamonas nauphoetae TaxID=2049346 RepID=A0ABQ9XUL8_9EUKA|nr:hypothetical protein BLNAU_9905 [Blattamonas nauphoetae]